MNECESLFSAEDITANYSKEQKVLVISATVTLNPFADEVRICANPLQPIDRQPREYMVVGSTKPGIHPLLVVKRLVSASFSLGSQPDKIVVYSRGVDAPKGTTVGVDNKSLPVDALALAQPAGGAGAAAIAGPIEATGWSREFNLQEAFSDAVAELRQRAGFRNPDIGLHFEVTASGGQIGGFVINTGAFVTVKAS